MSDEIRPALSAEEWARLTQEGDCRLDVVRYGYVPGIDDDGTSRPPRLENRRHALAALALHGQPFGFTWEDVDAILDCAGAADREGDFSGADIARHAATKLAALLPPREEG